MAALANGVSCEYFEDGAVVLDAANGKFYTLNATAGSIIRMLSQEKSDAQVAEALASEFPNENKEEIVKGILDFIAELRANGLLVRSGGTT